MPELPEVTTIVSGINKNLLGLSIRDVWTDWPKIIKSDDLKSFTQKIVGKKIIEARRVGKNILIYLSGDHTILLHMKMTGHLLYGKWVKKTMEEKNSWIPEKEGTPLSDPYNKYLHVIFTLSNGKQLAMSDVRKFGKILLLEKGAEHESRDLKNLGPDPMGNDFDFHKLKQALFKRSSGTIKQTLMNQEIISGIGNIYSDEILWEVGMHPKEKLKNISEEQLKNIFSMTKKILKASIDVGGDSMSDFRNIYGEKGKYQNKHKAYKQTGKNCAKDDGGKIIRIKVGGRSAHFCETHQRLI